MTINILIDTENAVGVRCFTVLFLGFSMWGYGLFINLWLRIKKRARRKGVKNATLNKSPSRDYLCLLALLSITQILNNRY